MWTHSPKQPTYQSQLWDVLADISRWPGIDSQIESFVVQGVPQLGTHFKLKPKGGPTLSLVVDRLIRPLRTLICARCRSPRCAQLTC